LFLVNVLRLLLNSSTTMDHFEVIPGNLEARGWHTPADWVPHLEMRTEPQSSPILSDNRVIILTEIDLDADV
jgi:hypothetical protein